MKHRNDFVSNSSSTCYMISLDNDNSKKIFDKEIFNKIDTFFKYDFYTIINIANIRKELVDCIIKNDSNFYDHMDYNPETNDHTLNKYNFHIQTISGWEDVKIDFDNLENLIITSTESLVRLLDASSDEIKQIIINNILYTISETIVEEPCEISEILDNFKKWLKYQNISFSMAVVSV